jgi:hypothetical protein
LLCGKGAERVGIKLSDSQDADVVWSYSENIAPFYGPVQEQEADNVPF